MSLLLSSRRLSKALRPSYATLLDVVKRKRAGEYTSGLHISDESLLDWENSLRDLLP